jgi:hypothetical protein
MAMITKGWALVMIVGLVPSALRAEGPYLDYSTFSQWMSLAPEYTDVRVCGLTSAAHSLWAEDQLRVPESTFLVGNFTGTGRRDWIVPLYNGKSKRACDLLLIVRQTKRGWRREFLYRTPDQYDAWSPRWFAKRRSIAVDRGERRRRTAAAILSKGGDRDEGRGSMGFVVEDARVRHSILWNAEKRRYEVRTGASDEWWEIEQN